MSILLISLIPAALAIALWAVVDLENFLLFGVLAATIFPATLFKPGGTNVAAVDILIVLGVVAWLIQNAHRRAPDPLFRGNPLVLPALLFTAWNTVTIVWSISPSSTLKFSIQLLELTIVFPLAFSSLPVSLPKIRLALHWFVSLCSAMAFAALIVYLENTTARQQGIYLPGLNKNALGSFVAAGLVLAFALWTVAPSRRAKVLLTVAGALNALGLVASDSRGAMLGAIAALFVVGMLLGYRRLFVVTLVVLLVAAYVLVVQQAHQASTTGRAGAYSSSSTRYYSWIDGFRKIENDPWLGTGGQTYIDVLPQLHNFVTNDPQNLFLLTWAEEGIPGLLLICFLIVRFGQLLWQARKLPRDVAALAAGAGGVALAALVHFQVDGSWQRGETTVEFVMLGLMVAIIRLTAPEILEQVATARPRAVAPATLGGAAGGRLRLGPRSS